MGPYQFTEKLIPLIITNCLDLKPLPIYGDGSNVRDWLYVIDHCIALTKILDQGKPGQSYVIGGNQPLKNIELVTKICQILDELKPLVNSSYLNLIEFVDDRQGHDLRYSIDSSKIFSDLGWKPTVSFDEGLKNTIDWYINNEIWWRDIQKKNIK